MIRGGTASPRVIVQGGIEKKMEGKENDEEGGATKNAKRLEEGDGPQPEVSGRPGEVVKEEEGRGILGWTTLWQFALFDEQAVTHGLWLWLVDGSGGAGPACDRQGGLEKKMTKGGVATKNAKRHEEGGLRLRRQCAQRRAEVGRAEGDIICDERLGGMLRYYRRAA